MKRAKQIVPWHYAATYAGLASAWIVFSDLLVGRGRGDAGWHWNVDTVKGIVFVAVTALLLYGVLARLVQRLKGADEATRHQEQRWKQALDGVGDGLWDCDLVTGSVYYSPHLERMLGYAAGEFLPNLDSWAKRVHPDDLPAVMEKVERHRRGETETYESEYRVLRKDGTYQWLLGRGVVIERDAAGAALRMVDTHQDISLRKELASRLKEQAERYEALFAQSPHPMWIYDLETRRILEVNDAAIEKYGYSREDFLAKTILDLRPPSEQPRLLENLEARSHAVRSSGPWQHQLADGSIILVEILSHSIEWRGRLARVVVAHDVTVQRRAVHEIEESEQKFRAIFQSVNDAIFTADERFRITDCNPRALELLRLGREGIIGHLIPEFFPERQPDGVSSLEKARRILHKFWHKPTAPFEWTLRCADGTCFDSEITLSGLQHEGRRSIVVVARDLTERKRSTRELQLLHAALQATPAGIVVTDAEGNIEWVNPAFTQLTGYQLAEVQGQTPRVLRSGQHDAAFYREMWATIRRGEVWSGEIQNRRKDGLRYFEHMTIAPVRNSAGEITNFVAVKDDVTNERRLEQQLARAAAGERGDARERHRARSQQRPHARAALDRVAESRRRFAAGALASRPCQPSGAARREHRQTGADFRARRRGRAHHRPAALLAEGNRAARGGDVPAQHRGAGRNRPRCADRERRRHAAASGVAQSRSERARRDAAGRAAHLRCARRHHRRGTRAHAHADHARRLRAAFRQRYRHRHR
jgi:PAS domain S-box-containing protein